MNRRSHAAASLLFAVLALSPVMAESTLGRIDGRVSDAQGAGQSGVSVAVVIEGAARVALTDPEGAYAFASVPSGTYDLTFTLGQNILTETGIVVTPGQTANVDVTAVWEIAYAESVTVYAASRAVERIVDAPTAISVVTERQIERQAGHGQLPKLLEFVPGAEVTQSGLYDFNLNSRGFNSSLNRRVATLIDGRDPSVPFLGAQEWAALSFPLDDLAGAELLRGPSAALYGKNAASGVLNLTTKQPRYNEGGLVRMSAGELDTTHVDFRWAGHVFADWYVKIVAGLRSSGDFSRSRNGSAEYSTPCLVAGQSDCLPQEVPLARVDDDEISFGGLRVDKYWGNGSTLTLEGGLADIAGPLFQTGIGRVQLLDVQRPWARARWSDDHWNIQFNYTRRDAPRQRSLATGLNFALDTRRIGIEAQTHWRLADERLRLVFGGSLSNEDLDSLDPATGRQSLMFQPVDADAGALFGQANYQITSTLEAVFAARWDDGSLHASQLSPKAALVWSPAANHTLRLTYNEAFQVANFSEFFLQAPAGPAQDLSALEAICSAETVDCGFGNGATPLLALGNANLELEQVESWELGWSGILAGASYVTVDYYRTENDNFITDLVPQCGTALGSCATATERVNPAFGPYLPPSTLSGTAQTALLSALQTNLGPSFALLSNNLDGTPIFAAASYTNFGRVETQGVDVGLNHFIDAHWTIQAAYSWFDYDIDQTLPGLSDLLLPNSPEHKASTGVRYTGKRFDGDLLFRWSDEFRWVVGPFQGDVPAYETVDFNANYRFGPAWKAGLTVANLLDDAHFESFGGDLLGRRALGHLTFSW
jgi:outer membrane receptor for ferrienterochelin and colicins